MDGTIKPNFFHKAIRRISSLFSISDSQCVTMASVEHLTPEVREFISNFQGHARKDVASTITKLLRQKSELTSRLESDDYYRSQLELNTQGDSVH